MTEPTQNQVLTDLHEDRWNRLTISSRKEDLKSFTKRYESQLDDYLASTKPQSLLKLEMSFQNQTMKELSKENKQLDIFSERVIKEFEHLLRTKRFPSNSYRFPISNEPRGSHIVNSEEISPLLKAKDNRIQNLENEMDSREKELIQITEIVNLLIQENKYLRNHIAAKNKDIYKLLDTVGLNDGESIHELKQHIHLLNEENKILISHLEQFKQRQGFSIDQELRVNEALSLDREYKKNLEEALKREEDLTHLKQTIETKFKQAQDKIVELESKLAEKIEELTEVNNKYIQSTNQITSYKKQLKEIEDKNANNFDEFAFQVKNLQNENTELKQLLENKIQDLDRYETEARTARKDFNLIKLENEELVKTRNEIKNELSIEKVETERANKRENDVKERNKQLVTEIEKLRNRINEIDDEHKKVLDKVTIENLSKQNKNQQKIEKLKIKRNEEVREKDDKISFMEIRLKETEKLLAKAQKEREQTFVKLNEARKDIEVIHQIKKDVTHYERTIENLQKDLLTCQEEKRHLEKGYRDLQTKLSNAASKAEPSVENKKKREEEHSRKSSEVEQENEYLRLLLKHSVEEEKPSTSRTQIRHVRHSSVTPSRREASKIDSRSNSQLRINFRDAEFEPQPIPASTTRFEARRDSNPEELGKILDEANVERVVSTVLKKYNLRDLPNASTYREKRFEKDAIVSDRSHLRKSNSCLSTLPVKPFIPNLSRDSFDRETN